MPPGDYDEDILAALRYNGYGTDTDGSGATVLYNRNSPRYDQADKELRSKGMHRQVKPELFDRLIGDYMGIDADYDAHKAKLRSMK